MQFRLNENREWECIDDNWEWDNEALHFSVEEALEVAKNIKDYI